MIVREMGPWSECIFRSLLQFLVKFPISAFWVSIDWFRVIALLEHNLITNIYGNPQTHNFGEIQLTNIIFN